MNTLKLVGLVLSSYFVPILFLLGLILINVTSYIGFGVVVGLATTGITSILVAIILVIEQNSAKEPTKK
ncbi:hypothetical protein NGC87_06120 [Staphylococcus pseudoxylosus]|jgi:hypothetical protein|uniref:hypothetical protein n=1 Tax=Staphylococcus TaxID=1279 RepID=UPI0018A11F40|nr:MULTISPECIES: hypothetical protein [Staphylococcus]MBF7028924.1 hypothetical protein [Staphylococcus kloosii]MEB7763898.1 hypothetical protein [Staphylococcus pseudoxylosus]